jgi:hypothetical protein
MNRPATTDSPRRRAGKALVALSYPAALGLPLWTLPFSCGEDLTLLTGAVLFGSPVLLLGGFVLLVARRPRRLGYWGVAIAFGLPLWYVAALSTGCSTG